MDHIDELNHTYTAYLNESNYNVQLAQINYMQELIKAINYALDIEQQEINANLHGE